MFRHVLPAECNSCVENTCCGWWLNGCGLDPCFGAIADGFEAINPAMEAFADCIWVLGSPLAFPIVFCFPPGPETSPPNGGWRVAMLQTPVRLPCQCCLYTLSGPCGQWHLRRQALNGDMTRYKLWQGYHDGPHCCARRCPGAPITIRSGTYGEQNCPNFFLCLEVWVLGGFWSMCCAFDVTRRMMKDDRNLIEDPTEVRVNSCVRFFSHLAQQCCMIGTCLGCAACLVGCCAPDSGGAQECSGEAGRAARACRQCAYTCWRGIWSVKVIAMGCMSAQMDHEIHVAEPLPEPPKKLTMERGDLEGGEGDEEEEWWKKPVSK